MSLSSKSFLGLPVLAVAVAVALVLVGCVPQPTPATSDAATPTATSSPTPAAAALPTPTLPVTCADVLTDQAASDILQTPVQLTVDEAGIRGIDTIADRQAGLLTCVWGGESKTDNGWDDTIDLDVLPNAAADYDAGVWKVDDGATPYTVGDLSECLCSPVDANGQSVCAANLLLDGYWAHAYTQTSFTDGRTLASAEASMATLLDSLAATITAAGAPNTAWSRPGDAIAGTFCADPGASTGVIRDAFATPDLAAPVADESSTGLQTAAQAAEGRSGETRCAWSTAQAGYVENDRTGSVYLQIVPGGAWAFPSLLATPPAVSYMLSALTPVTVPGGYPAIAACNDANECYAMLSVGGSLLGIGGDGQPLEAFATSVGAVADAVLAAG